ncbi:MAG: hypothetical protein Q9187_003081 [Circinaria calcarea]
MSARTFPGNFSLEELKENGFMEASHVAWNGLTYPIYQIFTFWIGLDEEIAEVMTPILHLASALLDSSASISFLHAIMYGPRKRTEQRVSTLGDLLELNKGPPVTDLVRHQVALGLRDLHLQVTWEFIDPEEEEYFKEAPARTRVNLGDEVPIRGPLSETRERVFSEILISRKVFEPIRKITLEEFAETPEIFNRLLRLRFFMAVLLCHELCHAISNGVAKGTHQIEPYYMNDNINELGCVWENEVFGGRIVVDPMSEGHDPIRVVKWPAERTPGAVVPHVVARRKPKGSGTYYYVPMDWIANIQKQERWDEVWSEDPNDAVHYLPYRYDDNLLRIPKQIGARIENTGDSDEAWRKSQSSEGEWDEEGEYRRVLRFKRDRGTQWISGGATPVEIH